MPPFLEAEKAAFVAKHQVIENLDAEEPASFDETPREFGVLAAGVRVAAGVIVEEDDPGGAAEDRGLEYLARMNERAVEAADGDDVHRGDAVPGVDKQNAEDLAVEVVADELACRLRSVRGTCKAVSEWGTFPHYGDP